MSLTAMYLQESANRKFFMNSTYIMSRKQESNVFGLRSRNESNSNVLAGIGEKKIFHELEVHHVQKVRIKRFQPQEAEMSLTAMYLQEQREENF